MGGFLGRKTGNPYRGFGDGLYLAESWNEAVASKRATLNLLDSLRKNEIRLCFFDCGYLHGDGAFRFAPDAEAFIWEADGYATRHSYPLLFSGYVRQHGEQFVDPSDKAVYRNLSYCVQNQQLFSRMLFEFLPQTEDQVLGVVRGIRDLAEQFPRKTFSLVVKPSWFAWPTHLKSLQGVVERLEIDLTDTTRRGVEYEHWCASQTDMVLRLLGGEGLGFRVPASGTLKPPGHELHHALCGVRRGCQTNPAMQVVVSLFKESTLGAQDFRVWNTDWMH